MSPVATAGVFTQSLCPSAPVEFCRANLPGGRARALVVNSGNANAFTGKKGSEAARITAETAARAVGERLRLATYRWAQGPGGAEPLIEVLARDTEVADDDEGGAFEPVAVPSPQARRPARASGTDTAESFRSGLQDDDLGLSPEELAEFE